MPKNKQNKFSKKRTGAKVNQILEADNKVFREALKKTVAFKPTPHAPGMGAMGSKQFQSLINMFDAKLNSIRVNKDRFFTPKPRSENAIGEPGYLYSLLSPETSIGAKIPGTADASVPFHRRITITAQANAIGAMGILWQPTALNDTTTATSTLFINNSVGYDGVSVLGVNALAVATNFGLTTGTAIGWRLVSASMHFKTNASVLNSAGKVNYAVIPFKGVPPQATGITLATATGSTDNYLFVSNFENAKLSGTADIEQGHNARLLWFPSFPTHQVFVEPNNNYQTGNTGAAYQEQALVMVATGLIANQLMTIDLYVNYELQPISGSILQGMETICSHNRSAIDVLKELRLKHSDDIAFSYDGKYGNSGNGYRANNKQSYNNNALLANAKRIATGSNR
jgi:hypothetical protein